MWLALLQVRGYGANAHVPLKRCCSSRWKQPYEKCWAVEPKASHPNVSRVTEVVSVDNRVIAMPPE
jgi:hypothetical protein